MSKFSIKYFIIFMFVGIVDTHPLLLVSGGEKLYIYVSGHLVGVVTFSLPWDEGTQCNDFPHSCCKPN